jgi:hypothetical protein
MGFFLIEKGTLVSGTGDVGASEGVTWLAKVDGLGFGATSASELGAGPGWGPVVAACWRRSHSET